MLNSQEHKKEVIDRFITRLAKANNGATNSLRRFAGQQIEDAAPALTDFYQLVPPSTPLYLEKTMFLVATLYKEDCSVSTGHSLGWYAGMAAREHHSTEMVEKRFEVLLDSDEDQLTYQLASFVNLILSMGAKIDYRKLIADLSWWNSEKRFVQRTWAREFYNPNNTFDQIIPEKE